MHFYYDAQGRPAAVDYNGTQYIYLHNLQGDVVGLVDMAGALVVEYKYDAWGKIIGRAGSLVSTLGYLNPFRYRGYIYDEETGLYYLRSRYYNPEWGRFINADVLMGDVGALLSHNLFAYCVNCPIVNIDPSGYHVMGIPGEDSGAMLTAALYAIPPAIASYSLSEAIVGLFEGGNRFSFETFPKDASVDLENTFSNISIDIYEAILSQIKGQSKTKYRDNTNPHMHHIVARRSMKALPARTILGMCDIDINSPTNLVAVNAGKHWVMHTDIYYMYVNATVSLAYFTKGKEGVAGALVTLKEQVIAWTISF